MEHEEYHYSNDFYKDFINDINPNKYWHVVDTGLSSTDPARKRHLVGAYLAQVNAQSFYCITPEMKSDVQEQICIFIFNIENLRIKEEVTNIFKPYFVDSPTPLIICKH